MGAGEGGQFQKGGFCGYVLVNNSYCCSVLIEGQNTECEYKYIFGVRMLIFKSHGRITHIGLT